MAQSEGRHQNTKGDYYVFRCKSWFGWPASKSVMFICRRMLNHTTIISGLEKRVMIDMHIDILWGSMTCKQCSRVVLHRIDISNSKARKKDNCLESNTNDIEVVQSKG